MIRKIISLSVLASLLVTLPGVRFYQALAQFRPEAGAAIPEVAAPEIFAFDQAGTPAVSAQTPAGEEILNPHPALSLEGEGVWTLESREKVWGKFPAAPILPTYSPVLRLDGMEIQEMGQALSPILERMAKPQTSDSQAHASARQAQQMLEGSLGPRETSDIPTPLDRFSLASTVARYVSPRTVPPSLKGFFSRVPNPVPRSTPRIFETPEAFKQATGIALDQAKVLGKLGEDAATPPLHEPLLVEISGKRYALRELERVRGMDILENGGSSNWEGGQAEAQSAQFIRARRDLFPDLNAPRTWLVRRNGKSVVLQEFIPGALGAQNQQSARETLAADLKAQVIAAKIILGNKDPRADNLLMTGTKEKPVLTLLDNEMALQRLDQDWVTHLIQAGGLSARDLAGQKPVLRKILSDRKFIPTQAREFISLGVPAEKARKDAETIRENAARLNRTIYSMTHPPALPTLKNLGIGAAFGALSSAFPIASVFAFTPVDHALRLHSGIGLIQYLMFHAPIIGIPFAHFWHIFSLAAIILGAAALMNGFLKQRAALRYAAASLVLLPLLSFAAALLTSHPLLALPAVLLIPVANYAVLATAEEVIHRKFIFGKLYDRYLKKGSPRPLLKAVLLSSLIFSASHIPVMGFMTWHFVLKTLLGVLLALLYRRTGSLTAPAAAHTVYNLSVLLMARWTPLLGRTPGVGMTAIAVTMALLYFAGRGIVPRTPPAAGAGAAEIQGSSPPDASPPRQEPPPPPPVSLGHPVEDILDAYQNGSLDQISIPSSVQQSLESVAQNALREKLARIPLRSDGSRIEPFGVTSLYASDQIPQILVKVYRGWPLDWGRSTRAARGYILAKARLGGLFARTSIVKDAALQVNGKIRRFNWVIIQEKVRTENVPVEKRRPLDEEMEKRGVVDKDAPRRGIHGEPLRISPQKGLDSEGLWVHFDADKFASTSDPAAAPVRVHDVFEQDIRTAQKKYLEEGGLENK